MLVANFTLLRQLWLLIYVVILDHILDSFRLDHLCFIFFPFHRFMLHRGSFAANIMCHEEVRGSSVIDKPDPSIHQMRQCFFSFNILSPGVSHSLLYSGCAA